MHPAGPANFAALHHQRQLQQRRPLFRPDALYALFVLFIIMGLFLTEGSERSKSRAAHQLSRRGVSSAYGSILTQHGPGVISPRLALPELSLVSGKRNRPSAEQQPSRSIFLRREDVEASMGRQEERPFEDYYADDEDSYRGDDDDAEGTFARIEKAIVAPVHMIGKYAESGLGVGSILTPTKGKDHVSFPENSLVLITEMDQDFYRGYIINVPLSEEERAMAQQKLRLTFDVNDDGKNAKEPIVRLDASKVVFYGYGGPVKTKEERWAVFHDDVTIPEAMIIGRHLALNGDLTVLLTKSTVRMAVLYGAAVWIPGQLEREISDGLWTLQSDKVETFDDLVQLCSTTTR